MIIIYQPSFLTCVLWVNNRQVPYMYYSNYLSPQTNEVGTTIICIFICKQGSKKLSNMFKITQQVSSGGAGLQTPDCLALSYPARLLSEFF